MDMNFSKVLLPPEKKGDSGKLTLKNDLKNDLEN
jgi:hypothetical protein